MKTTDKSIAKSKDEIRQALLQERLSLPEASVLAMSSAIQDTVLRSPYWPQHGRIGLYSSVKNEVLTFTLFQKALEQGLHVYFPRVEQGLKFYEVNGPEELQRGAWAIPEPIIECKPLLDGEVFDLLIVPGVAFTKDCHRIGYGKAFYDRVMEDVGPVCVGLAYDFQVVPQIPTEPWDKILTAVVTEKRVYELEKRVYELGKREYESGHK